MFANDPSVTRPGCRRPVFEGIVKTRQLQNNYAFVMIGGVTHLLIDGDDVEDQKGEEPQGRDRAPDDGVGGMRDEKVQRPSAVYLQHRHVYDALKQKLPQRRVD
jgi:hypothetical protein